MRRRHRLRTSLDMVSFLVEGEVKAVKDPSCVQWSRREVYRRQRQGKSEAEGVNDGMNSNMAQDGIRRSGLAIQEMFSHCMLHWVSSEYG